MDFQTLYRELTNSTETIRSLVKDIDQKQARGRPDPQSWSILEVLCHLYDEERDDFRFHLDWILSRSGKWPPFDPRAWVKERKYNQQDFDTMKARFFRERRKSLAWLKTLEGADWKKKYTADWGILTAGDMFTSWVAHDNLHIRQLVELRRARIEKITKPYHIRYAGEW